MCVCGVCVCVRVCIILHRRHNGQPLHAHSTYVGRKKAHDMNALDRFISHYTNVGHCCKQTSLVQRSFAVAQKLYSCRHNHHCTTPSRDSNGVQLYRRIFTHVCSSQLETQRAHAPVTTCGQKVLYTSSYVVVDGALSAADIDFFSRCWIYE